MLETDRTSTLCGVQKHEEPGGRESTDKHCFPCMQALQAVMAAG
ncbi:hypothetical protein ACL02U_07255 [Streptomyces sp. MS06]